MLHCSCLHATISSTRWNLEDWNEQSRATIDGVRLRDYRLCQFRGRVQPAASINNSLGQWEMGWNQFWRSEFILEHLYISQDIYEEIILSYEKVGKLGKIPREKSGVEKNSRAEIIWPSCISLTSNRQLVIRCIWWRNIYNLSQGNLRY